MEGKKRVQFAERERTHGTARSEYGPKSFKDRAAGRSIKPLQIHELLINWQRAVNRSTVLLTISCNDAGPAPLNYDLKQPGEVRYASARVRAVSFN